MAATDILRHCQVIDDPKVAEKSGLTIITPDELMALVKEKE